MQLSSETVWQALSKELFGVLGMVTAKGESRTTGVVYVVANKKLYVGSRTDAWKVRHVQLNPHVSMTITIHKQIPFMPWIKIPPATITFAGEAAVYKPAKVDAQVVKALFKGLAEEKDALAHTSIIEITPKGDFLTYGVGVSLLTMRNTQKARGRVPVA
ncbi:MAG: hypothetical protein Kow0080_03760 [Candidatus Promineifilaceae bacterium]